MQITNLTPTFVAILATQSGGGSPPSQPSAPAPTAAPAAVPGSTGTAFGVPSAAAPASAPGAVPVPGGQPTVVQGTPGAPGTTGQATTTGQPLPGTPAPARPTSSPGLELFVPLILVMVVLIGMSILTGRREKKKREALMSSIKRNDRVMTAGGIIGTVTELGDQDIVLKVEDGRIRFSRASIQTILQSAPGSESSVEDKPKKSKELSSAAS
jgi:preprotein translocase subunit YajC